MKRLMEALTLSVAASLAFAGAVAADDHAAWSSRSMRKRARWPRALRWMRRAPSSRASPARAVPQLARGSDEAESFFVLRGAPGGRLRADRDGAERGSHQYMRGLYAAVVSSNPALNGVHMLDPTGAPMRVTSGGISRAPNEWPWPPLSPSTRRLSDYMYVISISATMATIPAPAALRVRRLRQPEVWTRPTPCRGRVRCRSHSRRGEGVAVRDDTVYAAVTEQGTVVGVPILDGGAAGEPFVYAELPGALTRWHRLR